ncbi:hypothetical protein Osc2_11380 [Ruminococcus sp. 25CYCFAH16]
MKVLSLFDGISCGRLALERANLPVEKYDAFEIDRYAIAVSQNNYPDIVQHGDVFNGILNSSKVMIYCSEVLRVPTGAWRKKNVKLLLTARDSVCLWNM